jgi:hypothetical protein
VRVKKLIDDYYRDPQMPQVNRILTQPDMLAFLRRYHPTRKGWPLWTWLWLAFHENKDALYGIIAEFLINHGIEADVPFSDLLTYQREIMLSPDYDPEKGKIVACDYNWQAYFFEGAALEAIQDNLSICRHPHGARPPISIGCARSEIIRDGSHRLLLSLFEIQTFLPSAGSHEDTSGINFFRKMPPGVSCPRSRRSCQLRAAIRPVIRAVPPGLSFPRRRESITI